MVPGEDLANARLAEPPRPPVAVEAVTGPELLRVGDALARRTWEMGLNEWFWGEGVCLLGLVRLARAQGQPYPRDVLAWLEERVRAGVTVEHVNHLAPGTALALAIGERPDLEDALHELVAWLGTPGAASYDADGTLEHWPGGIWADTVFMSGVSLGHIGLATGDHRLIIYFADQVRRHIAVLQDPETGLFVHGSHRGQVIRCFWGRANAWCALAMVELLEITDSLGREQVESLGLAEAVSTTRAALARQLVALADLQPEHGVWSVLVDEHPETAGLVETSAAAGIGAAMLRARRLLPDLPPAVHRAGWRAVRGVMAYVDPDGTLTRTSAGTVLQLVPFGYSVIRDDRIQPWGQGLALHAVAAALEALNSGEEPM
jgi:unsaturated rhamnogalacturonyl hydrolase